MIASQLNNTLLLKEVVMKKLKLDLNDLKVESLILNTKIDENSRGTVQTEGVTCNIPTCDYTCLC